VALDNGNGATRLRFSFRSAEEARELTVKPIGQIQHTPALPSAPWRESVMHFDPHAARSHEIRYTSSSRTNSASQPYTQL